MTTMHDGEKTNNNTGRGGDRALQRAGRLHLETC